MTTPLTDAGVGRAFFTTRIALSLQAFQMCILWGAVPAFVLPYVIWAFLASPTAVDLVRMDILSGLYSQTSAARWKLRDLDGEEKVVEAILADGRSVQWLTPPQAHQVLRKPLDEANTLFGIVKWISLVSTIAGYIGMTVWLRRLGGMTKKDERVRGAQNLASAEKLSERVRSDGGGAYTLAGVALPQDAPSRGILIAGAQGSGKSVAIHDLMRQVMAKGRKCVIYDQSGEYMTAYFRAGKDVFFNPAFIGSVPWSIFKELHFTYDADTMARAFLPPKAGVVQGGSAFFEDAARALFATILLRLRGLGATATPDIAKAMLEMPHDEMEHLVAKSVASSAVGGDAKGQRQGVISSISIYLNGIAAVKPGKWSVREFLDAPGDGRLFILGNEKTDAMLAPLYRLMLATLFSTIAGKQEVVREDKYWFFLDEKYRLGDIRIDEVLATYRKNGVCIVGGIQSDRQLVAALGAERAETAVQCFCTTLVLAANEPGQQERFAKRLGRQEIETVSNSQALAVTEWRDGGAMNRTESEKWLVMPSQLGELDSCTGFLKLPGSLPACSVNYRSWLRPGWFRPAKVEQGAAITPLPTRDPDFVIKVDFQGDPFARVAGEVKEIKETREANARALKRETDETAAQIARQASPATPPGGASNLPDARPSPYLPGLAPAGAAKAPGSKSAPAGARPEGNHAAAPAATQTAPAAAAAPADGPSDVDGARGGQSVIKAGRYDVDGDSGEILEAVDPGEARHEALLSEMDATRPGQTLGLELGDDR